MKTKHFEIANIVYLITDNEQQERIVTGITERISGYMYELTCGTEVSYHYYFEITKDLDILKQLKR